MEVELRDGAVKRIFEVVLYSKQAALASLVEMMKLTEAPSAKIENLGIKNYDIESAPRDVPQELTEGSRARG